ncbi:hypothetical protein [Marininema halotolerans]|uniref:Uncharacterized protein n=1 Tax=Marininema halotolerans TaxID=1155944 RepID=A0A1I6S2S4_9BACL|nr:hypothetical protein [Marininema halotolerans]SFS71261.1 hypothetical protein SAMN05444972_106109 [Marininema halotolerans]
MNNKNVMDQEKERLQKERWILLTLACCAVTFAGLVLVCGIALISK